jgi:hypothetical protein
MITAANIHYELGERARGLAAGGLGALLLVARRTGLIAAIDHDLHLLKRHLPYFESDHVLNIAFNLLAGGRRLEHLELRRNDEVYLDALGAMRIPDPTTAGDFCRRFVSARWNHTPRTSGIHSMRAVRHVRAASAQADPAPWRATLRSPQL